MGRYDIDWLRVIALGLLIIYHTAIIFQPWGVWIRFPQRTKPWEGLWLAMSIMNPWRIPLLFFVAGMGAWFSIQRRGAGGMLMERSLRILLPLVFCSMTIVPLYYGIYQKSQGQDFTYVARPSQLWFLVNIFIDTLLFSPLMFYFKQNSHSWALEAVRKLLRHPAGLFALQIPFIIEVVWVSFKGTHLIARYFSVGCWKALIGGSCGKQEQAERRGQRDEKGAVFIPVEGFP